MVGITGAPTGAAAPAGAAITAEPRIAAATGAQRPARGRDREDMEPFRGGCFPDRVSGLTGAPRQRRACSPLLSRCAIAFPQLRTADRAAGGEPSLAAAV